MADNQTKLAFTPQQLAKMMQRAVARETKRIAEEVRARAEVERSIGNEDTAQTLEEVVEGFYPTIVEEVKQPDMSKLVVKGLEDEEFPGYDAALDDDTLPPMREHSDREDISALVRRIGA